MPPSSEDGTGLNRRSYLGIVGAASTSTLLIGRAGADEGPAEDDYDRVVDIVEAGADDSGEEPIDDVFAENARDDTLIEFPSGTYLANELILYGLSNFAMVGDDATLVPGDDYNEEVWLGGSEVEDLRVENFTIDNTADGAAPEVDINANDGLEVRNVRKEGFHDGQGIAFAFRMMNDDGEGLVESVRAPDGGEAVGIYIDGEGPVTVRDCHVEGFTNNGLYASHVSAPVTVEGGLFKDNNIAQVRLGSADSSITGARLEVTRPVKGPDADVVNMRGLRIADGPGPVSVDDCDIVLRDSQGAGGIVTAYSGGSLEVSDTRIRVDESYTTISSDGSRTSFGIFVDDANGVGPGYRRLQNVSITGGGQHMGGLRIRRSNNTVEGLCLDQTGEGRDGIILEDSSNNTVTDSTIDVPGREFVMRNSSAKKANISTSGSCPTPDDGNAAGDEEDSDGDTASDAEEHYGQPPQEDGSQQNEGSGGGTNESTETGSRASSSQDGGDDLDSASDEDSQAWLCG